MGLGSNPGSATDLFYGLGANELIFVCLSVIDCMMGLMLMAALRIK
jgi:hypothetical protein